MSEERPDPDRLLARLREEPEGTARGRFKVFFGASAGVGKTYAMLEQAQLKRRQGVDVVAGCVETHGRAESEALLRGLEILPPRILPYRGIDIREFDLDAALARRPRLLLLDELAHSNVPGSRHRKRWQDAEELLAAGIDVYTTVNVQHLESLNDVIAQTTGIVVRETLPDRVLEQAHEIEVVDLTPDDLLQRIKEGKVYIPEQAERALQGFFARGNLIALRELALRRAAECVDAQVRSYRRDHGIAGVWPVAERILVCISPSPTSLHVVRAAGRMAAGLRADWIVAHVERPGSLRQTEADRERIASTLQVAEQLGAETVSLTGFNVSDEVLAFARARNVSKIVVGKPAKHWWRYRLFGSVVDDLVRKSQEIDVHVIRGSPEEDRPRTLPRLRRRSPARSYFWSALTVAAISGLARLALPGFAPPNLAMIYLLGVVGVAAVWGRGPSILASILGVAAFDFFYVPPYLTFAVRDTEYLVTFAVMLIVALLTSSLTVRLRQQADSHRRREERTAALYRMNREIARGLTTEEVVRSAEHHIGEVFLSEVWILLGGENGRLEPAPGVTSAFPLDVKERSAADWVFAQGKMAGRGTATLPEAKALYLPLVGSGGPLGVLGLFPLESSGRFHPEQIHLAETFADQTALVLERSRLAREAQQAQLRNEAERMRDLLLSSVSHDLRTPLAAITGAASTLLEGEHPLGESARRELTQSIMDDAERLNRLVGNLLSMSRIESGALRLQREWQPVEEVVGAALNHMERALQGRPVTLRIPEGLPLVPLDAPLIQQVLVNLLDNAVKYTPPGTGIDISSWTEGDGVVVEIADRGAGLPEGVEERVFEKFFRGSLMEDRGGVGLGLPICRGILEAHRGRIWAENRPGGGAAFRLFLPIEGAPPRMESLEPEA